MPTCVANVTLALGKIKNSVSSSMGSVSYLKAFIPIAVTNIIHNRVEYGEHLFDAHKLKLVPYKTFSKNIPKTHALFSVYHWLNDAIRDLDNKYMKELYFIIRNKETQEIVEYYTFSIEYTKAEDKSKAKCKIDEVLDETSKILETINALQEKTMLNQDDISYAVQIVLNDDAPKDYISKNFERATPYIDPRDSEEVTIGIVSTGYHKLKIQGNGDIFNTDTVQLQDTDESFDYANFGSESNEQVPLTNMIENEEHVVQDTFVDFKKPFPKKRKSDAPEVAITKINRTLDDIISPLKVENEYVEDTKSIDGVELSSTSSDVNFQLSKSDIDISCLCTLNYNIPMVDLTVCSICSKYQHVACVGYKSSFSVPKPHICYFCHVKTGNKMSDIRMYNARTADVRVKFAMLRLVALYCFKTKQSPETIIGLVTESSQHKSIYDELLKFGMLDKIDNLLVPNMKKLSTAINGTLFYVEFDPVTSNDNAAISIDD